MRSRVGVCVALVGVLFAVVLVGCSSNSDDSESKGEPGGEVTVAGSETGTPVSVEVGENSDTEYYMKVDPTSVAAGKVTFTLKNAGTKDHEMVVLKTDTAADALQVTKDRVSEADSVGEISETATGKTVSKTFDLEAGAYVLVCNISKHYEKHMYAAFTVT